MRAIAEESDNRFDWWIMKTFNVLPTDERFRELTTFQRDFIWENFLLDNPEIEAKLKKANEDDPDFNREWEELDKEEKRVEEDVDSDVAEKAFEDYLKNNDLDIPDVDEILRRKGIVLPKANEVDDWEEVD